MWSVSINRNLSFQQLLELQEERLRFLKPNQESHLLFAELKPTITLGSRQVHENAQFDRLRQVRIAAEARGIDVVHGHRGGNETWHGPGQWVGFVITPLEQFTGDPRGVRKAVCGILNSVAPVVREYFPEAKIETDDRMGIWASSASSAGKVVSVGIKIREGYITSGFSLNCYPSETSFFSIEPCGISGARPEFLFSSRVPRSEWEKEFETIPSRIFESFLTSLAPCDHFSS